MGAFDYGKSSAKRVAQIVNAWSSGGSVDAILLSSIKSAKVLSVGSVTAGVLKPVLSIGGSGVINIAAVSAVDATTRTLRLKITLDGNVIFDATSSNSTATGSGIIGIGYLSSASTSVPGIVPVVAPQRIEFDKSLKIECASSLTEAAPANLSVNYEVMQ